MANEALNKVLGVWKNQNTISRPIQNTVNFSFIDQVAKLFAPNSYYYYIVDFVKHEVIHAGGACKEVLGLTKEEVTLDSIIGMLHPDDGSILYKKEVTSLKFKLEVIPTEDITHYKTVYLWRILLKNGQQKTILHQAQALEVSEDGGVQTVLSVDTDITHLNIPMDHKISFISHDRPCYVGFDPNKSIKLQEKAFKNLFTIQELNIIEQISLGNDAYKIADNLSISPHTVKTHKRNILRKSNCDSTPHLITKCIREGLI